MTAIKNRLELDQLLMEIKEELIGMSKDGRRAILVGSPAEAVLAIHADRVSDYSSLEPHKKLMLDINFLNIHIIRVNIDSKHVDDREFIKHQVVAELCRYFDIMHHSLEMVKEVIFPYQNKLVEVWKKDSNHE